MVRVRRLIQKKTKRFLISKLSDKYSLLFQAFNKGRKEFCNISYVNLKFFKDTNFAKKNEQFVLKVDGQILPKIIETGTFDDFHYFFLKNKLKKNYVFIDVGSNHGFVSWQISKLKKIKKIMTYEPVTEIYNLSKINLNKIKYVQHSNAGWAEKKGKMTLYENPTNSGDYSLLKSKQRSLSHSFHFLKANDELKKIYKNKKNLKIILKTDCQGYDITIFNSIDDKYYEDIDIYFLECRELKEEQKEIFYKKLKFFKKIFISSPLLFKSTKLIESKDIEYYFSLKIEFDIILMK